ncbi:MAG TPA: TssQ family T6SS-associated lipoprotein [Albitalea sp.]|nr:TssQ family T6SS-associated lipoprotein [Albitalea sp.]
MRLLLAATLVLLLAACAVPPGGEVGLTEVASRPAEKALLAGIRAYDDGQYADAEAQLGSALKAGLVSSRDRAAANKYLAFIYCTSNRAGQCEAAFRAARQADPSFALTKSEAGHPLWGPVYRRALP